MFRRALIFFFVLTFASLGSIVFYTTISPSDLIEYNRLKSERPSRVLQKQPALQHRHGVKKDFWIPKETGRSHFSIECESSELILIDRNGKVEATELLQNVSGETVEKEELRRFTALEGTYFYPTNRLMAKVANFAFFRNGSPFFQGSAKRATCSSIGKNPEIHAESVELQNSDSVRALGERADYSALTDSLEINPSCRLELSNSFLQCEGPLTLHLEEQMAETTFPFHYEEEGEFRIDAESGKLLYADMSPQTIQCVGAVRLASNENYALADELVYFPETKTAHLFANGSNRVLFWKSDGSIQISAPEVAARLGEEEEIKGIGDVHCAFDLEEEHRIETIFGKYL